MITFHLMCANFFMINLNVIITFMLQIFNKNREALVKHVTLQNHSVIVNLGYFLTEAAVYRCFSKQVVLKVSQYWSFFNKVVGLLLQNTYGSCFWIFAAANIPLKTGAKPQKQPLQLSYKKGVLRNFGNSAEKHLY